MFALRARSTQFKLENVFSNFGCASYHAMYTTVTWYSPTIGNGNKCRKSITAYVSNLDKEFTYIIIGSAKLGYIPNSTVK